ncbi:hypothetical protein P6F26_08245 [Roseibacterium sp. SDUM158017]|uniref:hypothetical protein n=1 Tax=Roseicyclus salinarum TaxID=3036773 RepID=UPI002414D9C5|nr:hypothetical protein [Roseibacterium sp. SDUM158017]MDG4648433.1 hypothetical protein [Roseibacterium sp. SDUM158017]
MWNDVMCQRVGAPPLRFLGMRLDHVEAPTPAGTRLFLTLWARRTREKRDFVVALSEPDAMWKPTSLIVRDIEGALAAVEDRCARMRAQDLDAPPDGAGGQSLADIIEMQCRLAIDERRFRALAAKALDRWLAFETLQPALDRAAN